MKGSSLKEVLVEDLRDLLDAEKQLVKALPKMAKAASHEELETAFREHLEVTKNQVQRLEQVFEMLEQKARSKPCKGMKGLVEEGQEIIAEHDDENMLDAELLGAARKVEHYEIAGYEEVRSIARQLGMREASQLLEQTLREEMETDKLLAQISKRLTKEMSQAGDEVEEEQRPSRGRQSSARQGSGRAASNRGGGSQSRKSGGRSQSKGGNHGAEITTDHDEIRQWAEERGANPACVKGTGGEEDTGMIRLDFPGYSGEDSLQPISWDDWFEKFDNNNLALLYQKTTARGQQSNFNKLVSRETGAGRGRRQASGKARAAR